MIAPLIDPLTIGSLCAGIGGFDLGFERAGFETRWQVEIYPYCLRVLEKNFPHAKRLGDIRGCGSGNLPWVNGICAGFPCQPVSLAGKRLAQNDVRWLWPECARIIGELRPDFALLENVPGLLNTGMGDVLGDLSAIGYDAEWQVISAADVGAPHLRERVWIVAYPNDEREQQSRRNLREGRRWASDSCEARVAHAEEQPVGAGLCADEPGRQWGGRSCDGGGSGYMADSDSDGRGTRTERLRREARPDTAWGGQRSTLADGIGSGLEGHAGNGARSRGRQEQDRSISAARVFRGELPAGEWPVEPNVGRVAYGIPARVDRLKGLGNAVVPEITEAIAHLIRSAFYAEVLA